MKKGQKFFSRSHHRYVWFERTRFSRIQGTTLYVFRDICDAVVEIAEGDLARDLQEA